MIAHFGILFSFLVCLGFLSFSRGAFSVILHDPAELLQLIHPILFFLFACHGFSAVRAPGVLFAESAAAV